MTRFPVDVELLEWALLAAAVIVIAAGIPLILMLLRRQVARGGASDVAADEIASQTLAFSDAFRGASRRKHPAWDGHSVELAPPQEHF